MSRPLEFGICHDGQSVYSLFTWIEGKDAEEIIPTLTAAQQYQLGVQAGDALKKCMRFMRSKIESHGLNIIMPKSTDILQTISHAVFPKGSRSSHKLY